MRIKFLPAFNGDCILISFEYEGKNRNILIDEGVPRAKNESPFNETFGSFTATVLLEVD